MSTVEKFTGWHWTGGVLFLIGLAAEIGAMRVTTSDGPYLYGFGMGLVIIGGLLVIVGCFKWDRAYVEYDEAGEPVTAAPPYEGVPR